MDSIYNFIGHQYRVWDDCRLLDAGGIDASEVWVHEGSQKIIARQRRVSNKDIDAWLSHTTEDVNGLTYFAILRLVWVKFEHIEKVKHIAPHVLNKLLREFRIEVANDWNSTCFAGTTRVLDPERPNEPCYSYALCNHPKVTIAWSHTLTTGLTQGIYFSGTEQMPELHGLFHSLTSITRHPMMVALIFGISLSGLVEKELKTIKETIRAVEVRTRFHSWASRTESPAQGDNLSLSAGTTGAKTRLANLSRRSTVLHELCKFIRENLLTEYREFDSVECLSRLSNTVKLVDEYTQILEKRTLFQEADIQFFQQRTEAQSLVLSTLMAQEQSKISTRLANAMQQDSLSLKTLSLVTMCFLPGTFVATLFSVPLLHWEQSQPGSTGKTVDSRFWIYWAFTIPLTLVTFGFWSLWTLILKNRTKKTLVEDITVQVVPKGI